MQAITLRFGRLVSLAGDLQHIIQLECATDVVRHAPLTSRATGALCVRENPRRLMFSVPTDEIAGTIATLCYR